MAKVVRAILVCRKWNQQTRQHDEHSRREVDATKVGRYWRAGLKTFNADGTETRASRSGGSGFCRYHLEFPDGRRDGKRQRGKAGGSRPKAQDLSCLVLE
jgi:hypothetical protein